MTAHNWWSLVIRGLLAFAVGVIAIGWPGITLAALVLLFGAYALLDGVVSIIGAWRAARAHDRWAGLAVEGIAGIAAAATTVSWPAITAFVLVGIISACALITGNFRDHVRHTPAPADSRRMAVGAQRGPIRPVRTLRLFLSTCRSACNRSDHWNLLTGLRDAFHRTGFPAACPEPNVVCKVPHWGTRPLRGFEYGKRQRSPP